MIPEVKVIAILINNLLKLKCCWTHRLHTQEWLYESELPSKETCMLLEAGLKIAGYNVYTKEWPGCYAEELTITISEGLSIYINYERRNINWEL